MYLLKDVYDDYDDNASAYNNAIARNVADEEPYQGESSDNQLVHCNETQSSHPGDVRNVLTSANQRGKGNTSMGSGGTANQRKSNMTMSTSKQQANTGESIVVNGKTYNAANSIIISYISHQAVSKSYIPSVVGSLVDRGANGGIAGANVLMIELLHRKCDVSGINNYTMKSLPSVTCTGLVQTQEGPVIVIMHQYAYTGNGTAIHSSAQIEYFGNIVNNRSIKEHGKQQITTLDGYIIPLHIRNGLAYMDMTKPSQADMDKYIHVVLTSDVVWNPRCLDMEYDY
jgi:hypothetical protein